MTALLAFRPRHRPGGWTPKQLSTLSLWLDADDATTITVSTGVSQWDDKSGNGRNITQSTGANQPSWVKNGRNGRAVVRFDGTNHQMTGGDTMDLLSGGLSVMAAISAANGFLLTKTDGGVNTNGEWTVATLGGTGLCNVQLGGSLVQTGVTASGVRLIGYTLDRSNGATTWANGSSNNTDTGSPFPNTTSYDIAASLAVGGRSGADTSARMNGDLYELVASLATWTTDERQYVEGYLAHKWGLTSSLPADHPYKSVAP